MYFFCLTAFSASNTRFFHLMYFFRIVADFFHLKFFSRFQENVSVFQNLTDSLRTEQDNV